MITNKPAIFIAPILQQLAIDSYVDFTLGGDQLARKKPDAQPLLHTCQQFDCPAANAVMIGDSSNDIQAAHNAKITSIGLTYGYNYGKNLADDQPDHIFDQFSDILPLLCV